MYTAGFYAINHFTTPKAVSSRTRSRYYSSTLPVLYFPNPIPESFKWFDAPVTAAALPLTMSLQSILMLRDVVATIPSLSMTSKGRNNVT